MNEDGSTRGDSGASKVEKEAAAVTNVTSGCHGRPATKTRQGDLPIMHRGTVSMTTGFLVSGKCKQGMVRPSKIKKRIEVNRA